MKNKNIIKVRKELDKLDNVFLRVVKKRTELVKKILSNKKFKKDIIDRKRIRKILKNISIKSKKLGIDPKITNSIWKAMIRAYINFEFRNFKKKKK